MKKITKLFITFALIIMIGFSFTMVGCSLNQEDEQAIRDLGDQLSGTMKSQYVYDQDGIKNEIWAVATDAVRTQPLVQNAEAKIYYIDMFGNKNIYGNSYTHSKMNNKTGVFEVENYSLDENGALSLSQGVYYKLTANAELDKYSIVEARIDNSQSNTKDDLSSGSDEVLSVGTLRPVNAFFGFVTLMYGVMQENPEDAFVTRQKDENGNTTYTMTILGESAGNLYVGITRAINKFEFTTNSLGQITHAIFMQATDSVGNRMTMTEMNINYDSVSFRYNG